MNTVEIHVLWLAKLVKWADWVEKNPSDLPILLGYISSINYLVPDQVKLKETQ